MVFGKLEMGSSVLLENSSFLLAIHRCTPCSFSVFLMVDSWTLTLANAREACGSFHITLGFFVTSWIIVYLALGVIFVWTTAPGNSNNGVEFSPFVHYLSDGGLVSPNIFRSGFVTLSIPMSIDNSFSEVLRNLFWWHTSPNLSGEDQTLIVTNKVYVFHIWQGHPNSLLIDIPLIETPD